MADNKLTIIKIVSSRINLSAMHVSGGTGYSVFVDEEDNIWGIGDGTYGQPGERSQEPIATFRRIGNVGNIIQIACVTHTFALGNDGLVYSFGKDQMRERIYDREYVFRIRVAMVAVGSAHLLLLDNAGIVWGCGSNSDGQIGPNGRARIYTPEAITKFVIDNKAVDATPALKVFAFFERSYIVDDGGSLFAFGSNSLGTLGIGDAHTSSIKNPTKMSGVEDVVLVASLRIFTIIIDRASQCWYCGRSLSSFTFKHKPEPLELPFVPKSVACGKDCRVFIDDEGSLWMQGIVYDQENSRSTAKSFKFSKFTKIDIDDYLITVSGATDHFFASTVDNEVYGFGANHKNQVSPIPRISIFPPIKLSLPFKLKTYEKHSTKSARK